jgi:hypothetical protein
MSNEISHEGPPSALTEEDRLSAMIVERDVEIARLKGVIEHLQGVIGGLHMEAAQRDAMTAKLAEGSIGDDRKFCRLARAWDEADHDDGPDPVATWEAFVAYTDSVIAARKAAVGVLTDETEKQAARYRWLRDPTTDVALVIDKVTGGVPVDEMGGGGYRTYEYRAGEELDAAIDAAIESTLTAQVSGQSGEGA